MVCRVIGNINGSKGDRLVSRVLNFSRYFYQFALWGGLRGSNCSLCGCVPGIFLKIETDHVVLSSPFDACSGKDRFEDFFHFSILQGNIDFINNNAPYFFAVGKSNRRLLCNLKGNAAYGDVVGFDGNIIVSPKRRHHIPGISDKRDCKQQGNCRNRTFNE